MSERIKKGRKRNVVEKKGTIEKTERTIEEKAGSTISFIKNLFRRRNKEKDHV